MRFFSPLLTAEYSTVELPGIVCIYQTDPVFIAHAVLTLVHAPKGDSIVKFLT